MYGSGYLGSASQVQFWGSCCQDSGSQSRNFQVPGTYFQVPGCQGPRVPGSRVPESRVSGSQGPGVPGLRSQDPRYRVSGLDFRLCLFWGRVLNKLVFSRFFDICGNVGNAKEKPTRNEALGFMHLPWKIYQAAFLWFQRRFYSIFMRKRC